MTLTTDSKVYVTNQDYNVLDHKKAYVLLEKNSLWCYLLDDDKRVGIAFGGASSYAVDAIIETEDGAMGESTTGTLSGIQILLGSGGLQDLSREASQNDFPIAGHDSAEGFLEHAKSRIHFSINGGKSDISLKRGMVFLGKSDQHKEIILVVETDKLVFVRDELVSVLSDDKLVHVTDSGVEIGGKGRRTLRVGPGGISGIPGLANIGPQISQAVASAMSNLKHLKSLKGLRHTMKKMPHAFDDVDDFDWEDDE
ncbi:hypothetical protein EU537_05605 [Candidatus Thorarchaeota archaeon]|nr:MAG: hypothetical protein EU537_05605 [Candidatus Thorarchaeota archaeon]